MRCEDTQLEVSNVAWLEANEEPRQPTLAVRVSEDVDSLGDRLRGGYDGSLTGVDVDVTFRFQGSAEDEDARGVFAVANRVTGAFLLETAASGSDVMSFVAATRRYAEHTDGATRYRARVLVGSEPVIEFEKRTLLVYSNDGELLRQQSLIPSGVEI